MLRAKSQSQHTGRNSAQHRESLKKPKGEREPLETGFAAQCGSNKSFVGKDLKSLRHSGRKIAALLDFAETIVDARLVQQRLRQNVRGRNGVLNRKINSHASDRRHGMRGVSDTEQSRSGP